MYINSLVSIGGLVLDITGSWFLSRGLIKKSSADIQKETGFSFGQNNDYVIGGLHQKIDSTYGFWFLFSGFFLQAISYFVPSKIMVNYPYIYLIGIICAGVLMFWFSSIFSARNKTASTKKYLREYISFEYEGVLPLPGDMRRYFEYLGFQYKEDVPIGEQWADFKNYLTA